MTTIAVTGATGQLGRLAVDALLAMSPAPAVVALARDARKAASLEATGAEVRLADYGDRPALDAALAGVDTLLLVSGSEVGRRVDQHRTVVEAAVAAGVTRVVYTSAPHADDTTLVLAPEHKATEELLAASGLAVTVVRNNWYTENYAARLDEWAGTGEIVAAAGEGRVASATRADLAEGAARVAAGEGHEGRVYEFAGDTAWDFEELAAAASEVLGRPVSYRPVTPDELVQRLTAAGLDEGSAGFVAALDRNIAEGTLSDATDHLSTVLGRPSTPLLDGLRAAR